MTELTQYKCPKCGARLKVERIDHHLAGHEKLICPLQGSVGRFDDGRNREEIEDEGE